MLLHVVRVCSQYEQQQVIHQTAYMRGYPGTQHRLTKLHPVVLPAASVDTDSAVSVIKSCVAKPGAVPAPVVLDSMLQLEAAKLPVSGTGTVTAELTAFACSTGLFTHNAHHCTRLHLRCTPACSTGAACCADCTTQGTDAASLVCAAGLACSR